ncbi:hypothetical protein D082_06680 [Synechocystis sp. PCC 6714]|nr:hypothetical protein D082_06680 [Synechocystis sp. PCC 6714]
MGFSATPLNLSILRVFRGEQTRKLSFPPTGDRPPRTVD